MNLIIHLMSGFSTGQFFYTLDINKYPQHQKVLRYQ